MATEGTYFAVQTLSRAVPAHSRYAQLWPVGVVYGLVLATVWTPRGRGDAVFLLCALATIVALTVRDGYSARQLGLNRPSSGAWVMLALGALLVGVIAAVGPFTRIFGAAQSLPFHRAWQYSVWALVQELILQSFFFVRLESILGGRRAVWAASALFAVAHLPSPLLTLLSFLGALFFCEMFRRYRNILPLGIVHAALGLTVAASLPDSLLHHMRVGIGYVLYHP